jgi:hypothetical protein
VATSNFAYMPSNTAAREIPHSWPRFLVEETAATGSAYRDSFRAFSRLTLTGANEASPLSQAVFFSTAKIAFPCSAARSLMPGRPNASPGTFRL